MKIEKGIISNTQLMFLVIGEIQASSLTAALISGVAKQNAWIVLLLGFIITVPLLLAYTSLSRKYAGRNLIEINDAVYGQHFGKAISILYIYFFWFLIPVNIRYIADFFSMHLLAETDISVFIILIVIICIYTIRKGIEVIARTCFLLTIESFISAIFVTIFTVREMRLSNFLPLFQIGLKQFIQGTNLIVVTVFGEMIVFLMFFPYVNDIKKVKKSAFLGLIIGGMYFLTVILRNTAVLGNLGYIHVSTSYEVAKLINIGEIITRTEILVAVGLLFNLFVKIYFFYYATVLSIAQFFKLRSYKYLVIPVGIISLILSISMYNSPVEEAYSATNIYPIYAIPFVVLFPVISLIIDSIRKLTWLE